MRALSVVMLASGLALGSVSCANRAGSAPTRMFNGTLVVTDSSAGRFRIVGYDEVFTAPADTPLQALDGRNVQVEVTSHGRVERISDGGPSSE